MEKENVLKIKENPTFHSDTADSKAIKDENENTRKVAGNEASTLLYNDDIPLIDSQPESDDMPTFIEKMKARPNMLIGAQKMHFNPSVLESPDIFHLRAPIVSCENLLTPAISKELLLNN